jgi:chromosome segregation ATPase
MRQTAIDETMAILGALDEAGRINLLRDRIAARFGQEVVDRYLPSANTALRPPVDDKIALLENSSMSSGAPIPVSAGENHFIHASRHLSAMDAIEQGVTQGADPAKALTALQTMLPHLAQHIESMNGDETRKDQVALMRQRLQQLAASAQRLQDELQAQAENEAKAQQAEQQRALEAEQARVAEMERQLAESTMASPKLQQEIAERRAKLEMDIEKHKVELSLKQARATQDLLLKDAQSAAKVRSAATSETQPIVAQ